MGDTKRKKSTVKSTIGQFAIGAIGGFVIGLHSSLMKIAGKPLAYEDDSFAVILFWAALFFIISYFVQIIIHELGHLVFGLLTGYQFLSFRIGKMTLVMENGKLISKKFMVAGTGGQCLLIPPERNPDGSYAFFWYNWGGSIFNGIAAILSLAASIMIQGVRMRMCFAIMMFAALLFCLINAIPMKIGGISNDGYNGRMVKRDQTAKTSFYMQLKINALMQEGMRLKEMPKEWFLLPDNADLSNVMVMTIKILEGYVYYDQHLYDKASHYFESLLHESEDMLPMYENELKCELLFCEMVGECRENVISDILDKSLKRYIKQTNSSISKKRLMYAYELLVNGNEKEAEQYKTAFYRALEHHPVKADIAFETELLICATQQYSHTHG